MKEIVFKSEDNRVLTNSLLVAEKFEKEHRNVLQAIRNLISAAENSAVRQMFSESVYINDQGKTQPMFVMNRDGFSLLVMGFTGERALKFKLEYIEAFNKMEEMIRTGGFQIPQNYVEALRLAADQTEKLEIANKMLCQAHKQVAILAPKAELMDKVLDTDQKIDVGQSAKILGLPFGRNTLFQKLREKGVFFCNRNEPKQEYINRGYFELREKLIDRNNHDSFTVVKVLVTQKGLDFLARLFGVVSSPKRMASLR